VKFIERRYEVRYCATACSLPVMDSISTSALWRERRGRLLDDGERGDWVLVEGVADVMLASRSVLKMCRSFMAAIGG